MKRSLSVSVLLSVAGLFVGCSKEQKTEQKAESTEPQTIYGKSIQRAEEVSKLVGQKAVETADMVAERTAQAVEKLKTLTKADVDAWMEERKREWSDAAARIQQKAKARGNEAEPSVKAALERLRVAREAVERKASELKTAAETELPRLRRELDEAWRKLRTEEEATERTVESTA